LAYSIGDLLLWALPNFCYFFPKVWVPRERVYLTRGGLVPQAKRKAFGRVVGYFKFGRLFGPRAKGR